jgi:transcriptional regulator with PAS, ATPase and Fis domain
VVCALALSLSLSAIPCATHWGKLDEGKSRVEDGNSLSDKKADLEKTEILEALKMFNSDREQAAKFLGVSKITLYRKIKAYNLEQDFNLEK